MSAEPTTSKGATSDSDGNWMYLVGLLAGGLVVGFGIRSLYWSYGWAGHECLNCEIGKVGYSALDNLGPLGPSEYSVGMIVAGVLLMVVLNAGAWRRTGGY